MIWICEKVCEGLIEIFDVDLEMLFEYLREMYKDNVIDVIMVKVKYNFYFTNTKSPISI